MVSLPQGTGTASGEPHRHWDAGHRMKDLRRPDGRKVYVAGSPEEVEQLRRSLSVVENDAECVLHGSEEHLNALRHVHSAQQTHRATLLERHGNHFDELEVFIRDMDAIRAELRELQQHVIELDAVAVKYGYDSHVRIRQGEPVEKHLTMQELIAERSNASSMSFFVKPTLRQYYHKGLLWRASEIQEVGPYELFVDLVYVGVVAIAGDSAVVDADGKSLSRFAITFLLGWKFWSEINIYNAWFAQEDMMRRICIIFILVCLVGFTVNMEDFFGNTYTAMIAFYLTAVMVSTISFIFYASLLPMIRTTLVSHAALLLVSAALWIGSIHVPFGARYILIWLGLFIDIQGYDLKFALIALGRKTSRTRHWTNKYFEYVPAVSIEHLVSRTSAFVTLVFGYSVVSLLYQSAAVQPINCYFAKAALGLLQAFAFNCIYFEMDSFNLHTHAIRRHNPICALAWKTAHVPFIMSFVISAAALSRLVLAHDGPDTPLTALTPSYAARSQASISPGQRWFYGAGLGISLLCTVVIACTHAYKTPHGHVLLQQSRNIRLGLRALVGVVIVLLPLAGERLDSVRLIATTTSLLHLCLFSDLAGNMMYNRFDTKAKKARAAALGKTPAEIEKDDGSH